MEESDAELASRTRLGDLSAYAALMTRYRARLERYAFCLLGNREDAEEALQDIFLRAHRALMRQEPPRQLDAWLFKVLINRCRSRNAKMELVDRSPAAALAYDRGATPPPHDRLAWRAEIQRALACLPDGQREAFTLKYVEEFSYEEIEALTGVRVSALKMRVLRACERLRELLSEVYHD